MFQRPYTPGASTTNPLRLTSLSRGNSTDSQVSDEFVVLSPTQGVHQRRSSSPGSDNEFEMVSRDGGVSRTPSSNGLAIQTNLGNQLSRNVSFSTNMYSAHGGDSALSRNSSHDALSSQGLGLPPMSRAATDFFLARAAEEEEERLRNQYQEAHDSDEPPPTLSISRNNSRGGRPVQSMESNQQQHLVDEERASYYRAEEQFLEGRPEQSEEEEEEEDQPYEEEPPSPRTIQAHEEAIRYAWAASRQNQQAKYSTNASKQTRPSTASTSTTDSASSYFYDPMLRQRHQSSLGLSRVTGKSMVKKKERKVHAQVETQRNKEWEATLKQQHARLPGEPAQASSSALASSTSKSTDVAPSKPIASNLLVDRSTVPIGQATLRDVTSQLASTLPAHEVRSFSSPPAERSSIGKFHGTPAKNLTLPQAAGLTQPEFARFQQAFWSHWKDVIEECFHSVNRGLRLLQVEFVLPYSKGFAAYPSHSSLPDPSVIHPHTGWVQYMMDALNDPLGSGPGHTRLELVFHRPGTNPTEYHGWNQPPLGTKHRHLYTTCKWDLKKNGWQVYTPQQIRSLHASAPLAGEATVTLESGRQIRAHTVLACGLIQGWSSVQDRSQLKGVARHGGLKHVPGVKDYTPYGKVGSSTAQPKFDMFQPVKSQQIGGSTVVYAGEILAPILKLTYAPLDELDPPPVILSTHEPDEAIRKRPIVLSHATSTLRNKERSTMVDALAQSKRALQASRDALNKTRSSREKSRRSFTRQHETVHDQVERLYGTDGRRFDSTQLEEEPISGEIAFSDHSDAQESDDEEDRSYLRDWGSLSEMQRTVKQRQRERERERETETAASSSAPSSSPGSSLTLPRSSDLSEAEVAQLLAYYRDLDRAVFVEEQRNHEATMTKGQGEQFYLDGDDHESHAALQAEAYSSGAGDRGRSNRFVSGRSSHRASDLSSMYDDLDESVSGGLMHSKLPRPSEILRVNGVDAFGVHHNHSANKFLRVWPKRHQTHMSQANKNSKLNVNFPVKPKNQERLDNARNYRSEFYNSQPLEDEDY